MSTPTQGPEENANNILVGGTHDCPICGQEDYPAIHVCTMQSPNEMLRKRAEKAEAALEDLLKSRVAEFCPVCVMREGDEAIKERDERRVAMADITRVLGHGCSGLAHDEIAPLVAKVRERADNAEARLRDARIDRDRAQALLCEMTAQRDKWEQGCRVNADALADMGRKADTYRLAAIGDRELLRECATILPKMIDSWRNHSVEPFYGEPCETLEKACKVRDQIAQALTGNVVPDPRDALLRECVNALKPFSEIAEDYSDYPVLGKLQIGIRLSHIRAAAALLARIEEVVK